MLRLIAASGFVWASTSATPSRISKIYTATASTSQHGSGNLSARRRLRLAVVRDHVQELDLQFEPLGKVELKNISHPVEAFVVRLDRYHRPRGLRWKLWTAITVMVMILLAGGTGWWWQDRVVKPPISEGGFSIAVLPFANLGNDHNDDYLGDGIAEDLTTDLSHLDGAVVVARESAFTYRGKAVDIREVGRQLGVRYVLEGSVRKFGETLRINAQLILTDHGTHVWAERFDQPMRDLRDGQDMIVQRIGTAVNRRFEKKRPQNLTANPDAYDLVLRAKATLQEPRSDVRNVIAAGYFEQALRLDPELVEAQAGVASMILETNRPFGRAADLVRRASLAAPDMPDVLGAKFRMLIRQQRTEQALDTYSRLLDLDFQCGWACRRILAMCAMPHTTGPAGRPLPVVRTDGAAQSIIARSRGDLFHAWSDGAPVGT